MCRVEGRVREPTWILATLKAITTSKKELATSKKKKKKELATSKKPSLLLDLKGKIERTVLLGQN